MLVNPSVASLPTLCFPSDIALSRLVLLNRHLGPYRNTINGMGVASRQIPERVTKDHPGPMAAFINWMTETLTAPKRQRTRLNWDEKARSAPQPHDVLHVD